MERVHLQWTKHSQVIPPWISYGIRCLLVRRCSHGRWNRRTLDTNWNPAKFKVQMRSWMLRLESGLPDSFTCESWEWNVEFRLPNRRTAALLRRLVTLHLLHLRFEQHIILTIQTRACELRKMDGWLRGQLWVVQTRCHHRRRARNLLRSLALLVITCQNYQIWRRNELRGFLVHERVAKFHYLKSIVPADTSISRVSS